MSRRSDLKENLLAAKLERALIWAIEQRVAVLSALGFLVAALLVGSVLYFRRQEKNDALWTRLAQAQYLLSQKQFVESESLLEAVRGEAAGLPVAEFASFYLGEANLGQNDLEEALASYRSIAETGRNERLKPLAMANLGLAHERRNEHAAAAEVYRRFLDKYPDHFLAPRTQLALGRALSNAGEPDAAREALNHLLDLYPTSVWAENARRILDSAGSR